NREFPPAHHALEFLELARPQTRSRHRKHTPKQQVQQATRPRDRLPPPESEQLDPTAATQLRDASNHRMDSRTDKLARPKQNGVDAPNSELAPLATANRLRIPLYIRKR